MILTDILLYYFIVSAVKRIVLEEEWVDPVILIVQFVSATMFQV